jgi:hypothetical protein
MLPMPPIHDLFGSKTTVESEEVDAGADALAAAQDLVEELRELDADELSPREAHELLRGLIERSRRG